MSREAMDKAPRLKNGAIIPATAIRCANRFDPPEQQRWIVYEPWLPAVMTMFSSREAALAAILEHDRSKT